MKNITLAMTLIATSMTASANYYPGAGGFSGPNTGAQTVASVKKSGFLGFFNDDMPVVLTGHIVDSQGGEYYTFRDSTGTITLEIDYELWYGLPKITPDTPVIVYGEVDNDIISSSIDVDFIRLAS